MITQDNSLVEATQKKSSPRPFPLTPVALARISLPRHHPAMLLWSWASRHPHLNLGWHSNGGYIAIIQWVEKIQNSLLIGLFFNAEKLDLNFSSKETNCKFLLKVLSLTWQFLHDFFNNNMGFFGRQAILWTHSPQDGPTYVAPRRPGRSPGHFGFQWTAAAPSWGEHLSLENPKKTPGRMLQRS